MSTDDLDPTQARVSRSRAHAYVDGAAIELIPDSLSDQQREDALHWVLFGALAADAAATKEGYSRTSDPERWYKRFVGFLARISMRSDGVERHQANSHQLAGTVSETALNLLRPLLHDDNERQLAENALRDLQHDNRALQTFNEAAADSSGVNFLLIGACVDEHLNLVLHLTFIDFQTSERIENILHGEWDRSQVKSLFYGKDTLTLAHNLADMFRSTICAKLEQRAERRIAAINAY